MYTYMHICIYAHLHVHMCVYIYIYIHICCTPEEFGSNVKAIGEGFRRMSMQNEYDKARRQTQTNTYRNSTVKSCE